MSVFTKGLAMDFERQGRKDMAITSIWPAAISTVPLDCGISTLGIGQAALVPILPTTLALAAVNWAIGLPLIILRKVYLTGEFPTSTYFLSDDCLG
jgi:hypothetical protein